MIPTHTNTHSHAACEGAASAGGVHVGGVGRAILAQDGVNFQPRWTPDHDSTPPVGQQEAGNKKKRKKSAPILQKEPSLRCNHVFYWSQSLYMSIICPEEDFDIKGDSFQILTTSGTQGLSTAQPQALLPCVFLPVDPSTVTRAPLRPSSSSWYRTDPSEVFFGLRNLMGRVTQGWLQSHSYAHSSAVLCMRWQDSQAQAVSP